jgi:aspartyl-tRNA(Asn)/glutamyl-tRNA(Gln) amidotransferase subunit C
MATVEEVKKLAALARVTISDAELEKFTGEFDAILAYVGQLESLELPQGDALRDKPILRNVMREDGEPTAAGVNTEKITAQFPHSAEATRGKPEDGIYLEVKQIITHE